LATIESDQWYICDTIRQCGGPLGIV